MAEKNVIDFIKNDMKRHEVEVFLPGEKRKKFFSLTITTGKVNITEELRAVYGDEFDLAMENFARIIFGDQEIECEYGTFSDKNLKPVFCFNMLYADYDSKKQRINYKNLKEFLEHRYKQKVERAKAGMIRNLSSSKRGGRRLIKYSLTKK